MSMLRKLASPAQPRLRLLAFPYAGGSTASFARWPDHLDPEVELLAVTYPGRESLRREKMPSHVRDLLERVLAELAELSPLPLVLFGHSMGAIVAFELSHMLARSGSAPRLLVASGSEAPHASGAAALAQLDDEGLVRIADQRWDGFPDELREADALRASVLSLVRGDLALLSTCQKSFPEPLACPLFVLGGDRDPILTPAHLVAWRTHVAGDFELRMFEGGHLFVDTSSQSVAAFVGHTIRQISV